MRKIPIYLFLAAALPFFTSAAVSSTTKSKLQDLRTDRKNEIQAVRATNTKLREDIRKATSSDDKKELRDEIKDNRRDLKQDVASSTRNIMIIRYSDEMGREINNRILRATNIIDRLTTGSSSVLVKLETAGTNVTVIKAKFAEAKNTLAKATTDLASANALTQSIVSQNASTTFTRANYMSVRLAFRTAANSYKLAYQQLIDARKLLKEMPGVNSLGSQNGKASTSLDQ